MTYGVKPVPGVSPSARPRLLFASKRCGRFVRPRGIAEIEQALAPSPG